MSEEALSLMLKVIQEMGYITDEQKSRMVTIFGDRFATACNAVKEWKVKRYTFQPSGRVVWIVSGKERNYQILPLANFCSCLDFYFRVIGRETSFCYHLIAQKLAEALRQYVVVEEVDTSFTTLMERLREVTSLKRELSIAEVENIRKVAVEILLEENELPIEKLLNEISELGFSTLTNRHLANILIADKTKRFKHIDGHWSLAYTQ